MKLRFSRGLLSSGIVAPLAGAWIEIPGVPYSRISNPVAPLAGAWIEIPHLPQDCICLSVAPLAGAWIEILHPAVKVPEARSLPSRERGLKFGVWDMDDLYVQSLPSRERGLKFASGIEWGNDYGRSPRGSVD